MVLMFGLGLVMAIMVATMLLVRKINPSSAVSAIGESAVTVLKPTPSPLPLPAEAQLVLLPTEPFDLAAPRLQLPPGLLVPAVSKPELVPKPPAEGHQLVPDSALP